jgi:hypothetical protein
MALRKQDVVRLPIDCDQASVIPRPLLELYNRASLFLDKKSTHQDHYWAVGIHKAIHASFPDCGGTHTATTTNPLTQAKGSSSCQVSPQINQTHRKQKSQSTIKHRASKEKRRRKSGPQQLAFKLVHEDRADCRGSHDESGPVPFRRFQRAVSMEVGQRVVLVCTIWSTHNQMPIESGTWGEISEVGSTIKVEWQLPYYREPLWDRFPADEYIDYFEEELEMNSFSL